MKRFAVFLILPLLMGMAPYTPYSPYNFGPIGNEVVPSAAGMVPVKTLTGEELGVGSLSKPSDFRFGLDGKIYIADSGNNRILVLDGDLSLIRVIDGFESNGQRETFNSPEGAYAAADGTLYVADTQNGRIAVLNADGVLVSLLDNITLTGSSLTFRPQKVVVDTAGHLFAVSAGSTEGLVQLTHEGEFIRFFGSNKVTPNPMEVLYRNFLTRRQRQAREQFVPTEFSNIYADDAGFMYVTTKNVARGQVKRLNAIGGDVLKHDGISRNTYGDLRKTPTAAGSESQFQAVCADPDGNVYALDNASGRVFVYDAAGQMMFMFGGKGNQVGLFSDAQGLAVSGERVYVCDAGRGNITVFEQTDYGRKMMLANHLNILGEYELSVEPLEEVLRMDAGNTSAWRALGQAYFGRKEYALAMEYFKLGQFPEGYSKAFGKLRDQWLKENFSIMVLLIILGIAAVIVLRKTVFNRKRRNLP